MSLSTFPTCVWPYCSEQDDAYHQLESLLSDETVEWRFEGARIINPNGIWVEPLSQTEVIWGIEGEPLGLLLDPARFIGLYRRHLARLVDLKKQNEAARVALKLSVRNVPPASAKVQNTPIADILDRIRRRSGASV